MTLCLEMPTLTDSRLDTQALLDLGAACVQVARGNKTPLGVAWQERSTTSLAVIDRWLAAGYNVGILQHQCLVYQQQVQGSDHLRSSACVDRVQHPDRFCQHQVRNPCAFCNGLIGCQCLRSIVAR